MGKAAKPLDESLINFYDEDLLPEADTAYRFGLALTLSLAGAQKIVRQAFESLAANLEEFRRTPDLSPTQLVVQESWKAYQGLKGQKFQAGQSAVTEALKLLALEVRAAVSAVDVLGLTPKAAAIALGFQEKDLRLHLAKARQALMDRQF